MAKTQLPRIRSCNYLTIRFYRKLKNAYMDEITNVNPDGPIIDKAITC